MNSDLSMASKAVDGTRSIIDETSSAVKEATGADAIDAAALGKMIGDYRSELRRKFAKTVAKASLFDQNVTDSISMDKSQIGMQLMMARRSVSQLLNTWSQYTDYEVKKFKRMKSFDDDYLGIMSDRVKTANTTSRSSLVQNGDRISTLNAASTQTLLALS
jgi:hypothetical protein